MGLGAQRLGQPRLQYHRAGRPVPDILRHLLGRRAAGNDIDVLPGTCELQRRVQCHADRPVARRTGRPARGEEAVARHLDRDWRPGHGSPGHDRCRSLVLGADRVCSRLDWILCRLLVPGCTDRAGGGCARDQPRVLARLCLGLPGRRPAVPVQRADGEESALVSHRQHQRGDPHRVRRRRRLVDRILAAAVPDGTRGAADRAQHRLA